MTSLAFTISRVTTPKDKLPHIVFVHGLDSTRFTWRKCMEHASEKYNMIALDLRGHGESPLGAEEDFTADALVEDIRHTLQEECIPTPFILIGHSMGGRVAMAYGAKFPVDIACLVIEDMDIRLREEPEISSADMKDRRALAECRMFPSFEALEQSLSRWYDSDRVARWKEDGRALEMSTNVGENVCSIESKQEQESSSTTSWWCGVNPLAQFLARRSIMAVVGETEWRVCGDSEKYTFPIHLLVAGKLNTSCNINSLAKMAGMVPRVQKHTFHNAEHSIHRSEFEEYMTTLDDVIVPNAVSYYEGIQKY